MTTTNDPQTYNLYLGLITRGGDPVVCPAFGGREALFRTLTKIVTAYGIDGATFIDAVGMWKGALEPSITITVVTEPSSAHDLAAELAERFDQECVAVQLAQPLVFVGQP